MTRTVRRFAAVLIVALALFGLFASTAMAALEDTPTPTLGTTKTNPGWGADSWWREGWGNSLYPEYELTRPAVWDEKEDGYLLGTIYTVDRTWGTIIDSATPENYYRDTFPVNVNGRPDGTNLDNTIDLLGIYQNPPSGFWPPAGPGVNNPLEGQWFLHYSFYSNFAYQGGQWDIPFGVDLTSPTAVTGLSVSSGLVSAPYDPDAWVPTKRGYVTWDAAQYDGLSGVGYYQVLIDDQPIIPETSETPTQGRVYSASWLPTPDSITIESLPSGRHKLSIVPVDRATNAGPATSVWYQSDPDTPTISWVAPTGNALVPAAHVISVEASDAAGDPVVNISLGGTSIGTLTAPPYTITPDLSSLATGTYVLRATVTDKLNRTVVITKNVTWSPGGIAGSTSDPSFDVSGTPGVSPDSADPVTGGTSGWTNSLNPVVVSDNYPAGATDIFYNVVQSKTPLDPSNLQNYFHSVWRDSTHLNGSVSLKDSIDNPPGGGWLPGPAGSVAPYEGTWYYQWVWYNRNTQGVSPNTYSLKFNVDLTPPNAVTGFTASPAAGVWTASKRAHLTWDSHEYDAMSGDATFEIFIDGAPAISVNATSVMSGSATIEDMPVGDHKLSIAAVDKAGNVGPKSDIHFKSDTDIPKITWTAPTNLALNPTNKTFSVDATDAAGNPTVVFKLDGGMSYVETVTAPPYSVSPDLASLSAGAHTLTASVIDSFGRVVSAPSKAVTWDGYDGSLDTTGSGGTSSASGPGVWTNSLFPVVALDGIGGGITYNVVQTTSTINPASLSNYYHATDGTGPLLTHIVNLKDTIDAGGPWAPGPAGSVGPYEGTWYFQWKWHTGGVGFSAKTYRLPFNVDLTPPAAVANFAATPAAGTWTSQQRANFSWTNSEYDALSGTSYYQLFLDDAVWLTVGRGESVPNSITIEDMPAGDHKVSIAAVDKAGNVGPKSDIHFKSDTDVPTIAWTAPTNLALNPANHTFSVDATDAAGNPTVVFKLDGGAAFTATLTAPPYSVRPSLAGLSVGTHTLSASVIDRLGRVINAPSKTVVWDTYDGSLDTTGSGGTSSASGPGVWTNSLFPVVSLDGIGGGITYNVVQTTSTINPASLSNYYHSTDGAGPLQTHIVNLKDTIDSGGPWAAGPAGAVGPYEGTWYFQWKWHVAGVGFSSTTYRLPFNVDLTPPNAVLNFTSNPTPGTWTSQQRAKFSWTNSEYDALSGTEYYQLFLDDAAWLTVNRGETVPNSITVEDMPSGNHKISIAAVDKAGNIGPKRNIQFMSDPGVPSISFIEPTSTMTPRRHVIAVDASGAVADPLVTISISDGVYGATPVLIGSISSPPYSINPSFAGIPSGTYTLYARASDQLGRTVSTTMSVLWDATDTLVVDNAVDLADGQHIGTSSSNPGALDDIDTWWRKGWGNSLTPDFELIPPNPPVDDYGFLVGTLYDVTTSATDINVASPDSYFRAARGTGTNLNQTIDLQGIFNYPPAGGWRPFPVVGASKPIEGPWYLNLVWFTSKGYTSTRTYHVPMGIDLTPPSQIESLAVSPTINSADATQVIGTSRIHISWKPKEYDALSGVAYYQVVLDGSTVIPDSPSNPAQGRVYNIPGVAPSSVTIENLDPGAHTIGIQAVDRATNVGKVVTKTVYCDPDVPTISISKPSSTLIGPKSTVSASCADKGGVRSVVFKLDGVVISTTTSAPYSDACDLTGFASGTHTLTATVTDMFGRQATTSRTVTLDKTSLSISKFSRDLSLFYPIKRDKYYDNLTITFYASKTCSAKVLITNSSGKLVRTISKSASSGKNTVTWDGKWSTDGKAHTGTFYLQVSASDSVGNSTATGKLKTSIRNYQVVKTSSSRVKIIAR